MRLCVAVANVVSSFLCVCLRVRVHLHQESNSKELRVQSHDLLQGEWYHHEEAPTWTFILALAPPPVPL